MGEYVEKDYIYGVCNEIIRYYHGKKEYGGAFQSACTIKERVIEKAPADVAPTVHGHWIKDSREYECSYCGRYQLWMNAAVYQFCPHCGTKMDEEEENGT